MAASSLRRLLGKVVQLSLFFKKKKKIGEKWEGGRDGRAVVEGGKEIHQGH